MGDDEKNDQEPVEQEEGEGKPREELTDIEPDPDLISYIEKGQKPAKKKG